MISGELVSLRPIVADDLPIMRRWFDDPETMKHWADPRPFVREDEFRADLQGRFARFDRTGYFTILDPAGAPIGRIDFGEIDDRNRSCEFGILIGESSARGKGFGPDAIAALLRYLFRDRGMHRVELIVLDWNERAIRAYEKLGFEREGVRRDHRFADGRFVNEIQMSMLAHEYEILFPAESAS